MSRQNDYPRTCDVAGCEEDRKFETPQAFGKHLRAAHNTSVSELEGRPRRTSRRLDLSPAAVLGRELRGVATVAAVRCDGCAKLEEYDPQAFTWSRVIVQTPLHGDITLLFHSPACQKANFNRRFDERMRTIADAG